MGSNVTTGGNQTYSGPVVLGGNSTMTSTNSPVDFTSTVDGTHTLTVADGNALLGSKGDDWDNYSKCHLGLDR